MYLAWHNFLLKAVHARYLTHWGLVMLYIDIDLGQHYFSANASMIITWRIQMPTNSIYYVHIQT